MSKNNKQKSKPKRTSGQNQQFWALVNSLAAQMGDRKEAENMARDLVEEITGQRSTSKLDVSQFARVLNRLRSAVDPNNQKRPGQKKYDHLGRRPGMASPRQLRYLEAIAQEALRGKSPDERQKALRKIVQRQAGVSDLMFLEKHMVNSVLYALEEMRDRGNQDG